MKFRRFVMFPLLLLSACSTPPAPPLPAARTVVTVPIHGIDRSYILRIPEGYDGRTKLPLVMLLHGAGDSAAYAEEAYHFVEKSNAAHFVLVIPDGFGDNQIWRGFAPADHPHQANDDLIFLTTILETVPKQYAVDTTRMYACGHSAGAIMTYRLAAERPDLIAAAGIVAGTMGDSGTPADGIPTPRGPVPLIIFHGKEDGILPYDGGFILSVAQSIAIWVKANQCDSTPSTDRPVSTVRRDAYASRDHADIVLYTLDNGNHMWPGGKVMPNKDMKPVQDISATDLMWEFFAAHPHLPN